MLGREKREGGHGIDVEEMETLEALRALRSEWAAICEPTLNNDFDRFIVTCEAREESPLVVAFRREGRLVALLIGRLSRKRLASSFGYMRVRLPTLQCWELVHGGVAVDGDPDTSDAVISYVVARLRRGNPSVMSVNRLPRDHVLSDRLEDLATGARTVDAHWLCKIVPGSVEETLAHHSSKHRRNLRRYDRKLAKAFDGNAVLKCYSQPSDVDDFFSATADIANRSYLKALGGGVFDNVLWRGFLETEARLGRMASFVLWGGDTPLAYQNGVVMGGRFFCNGRGYLDEYSALRPGTMLFYRLVQELCERGIEVIDFGFGDAEYKRIYGTTSYDEATFRLYGRSGSAILADGMDRAVSGANVLAKAGIEYAGLVNKVKKKWRVRIRDRDR
jgi:CelD/BcsL family acetyltransferase involved in cellulose biosynthesis